MDLGLKGKVAFVAAASKGLGRAVAEELAAEGASLILCARNAETLNAVGEQILKNSGASVFPVVADVSKIEDIEKAVQAGIEKFGRIDILVTNAGGPPAGRFDDISREMWEAATRLTFNSVLELTRAVLPGMKERQWGRILNITSITVKQPVDNLMLSNSLRAAVTGFARTLANEVATDGITVNNILPGYTKTNRLDSLIQNIASTKNKSITDIENEMIDTIPMKRLGDASEIAAVAAFIASPAASYLNGVSIPVDGGKTGSI